METLKIIKKPEPGKNLKSVLTLEFQMLIVSRVSMNKSIITPLLFLIIEIGNLLEYMLMKEYQEPLLKQENNSY